MSSQNTLEQCAEAILSNEGQCWMSSQVIADSSSLRVQCQDVTGSETFNSRGSARETVRVQSAENAVETEETTAA